MKQFIVVGLGRFGGSVTKTLIELGHEVLAIDKDLKRVQEFSKICTHVYQADSTDELVLSELGVRNFDHAVVAIGDDIQSSTLTTVLLKELGVKVVTAKATSELHRKVLEKVGADSIVHPERDTGIRVAHQITSNNLIDFIELSSEYSLVEIIAPKDMHGKMLKELDIRAKYGCTVLAIKNKGEKINISPLAEDKVKDGDILVLIGSNTDIQRLNKALT